MLYLDFRMSATVCFSCHYN